MTLKDRIKELCEKNGVTMNKLESDEGGDFPSLSILLRIVCQQAGKKYAELSKIAKNSRLL